LSTRLLRIRLVAFVAAITLIVALGAYSAHGYGEREHDNGHCDLCVHFSGTAGSPAHATVVGSPYSSYVPRSSARRSSAPRAAASAPNSPALLLLIPSNWS